MFATYGETYIRECSHNKRFDPNELSAHLDKNALLEIVVTPKDAHRQKTVWISLLTHKTTNKLRQKSVIHDAGGPSSV